ncbi:GNAT family N-acetyltransferase [Mycobacterium sp. CBMA293]|uniref:N-acetylglutamate synthase, CG3035 family n=1 Tax=unclassified Mycolicibacterium TaxID=2636767 RepID=UPI0012DD619E|nr:MULTISPECIES: GNAT family N-acetyltransferase [unclassified Mycolicibacterium]MUL44507.1 GNAT family N-acetyltransferase [Mycolicibacterium sp. CBMA 360]MUL59827.1 GNAT family N-acetyltransferase [Mycolicibacterium sp. CBMA 335]MUL68670.1 GNAT family N-acetyltransferase [Mycolicibacterium sp. CBMA 311]MUL93939.1 GNAT family N-acetyltransferase [Mycolicibacterium sp. CBMA 230]MUM06185.1 GNAT family N-acetyltransferase [Mycolicibacterium sp. CBMA 213]
MPPAGVGSRVSLRYRLPESGAEAFTDVVGHLEALSPVVVVRTKSGELVEINPTDVVSVRELSHAPVRNSQIRAVEHAAALAWPGTEHQWLDGWLLRAAGGAGKDANSAVPLLFSSDLTALSAIAQWYAARGLPPWLALPERLLPVRADGVDPHRVLTAALTVDLDVTLPSLPDDRWLQISGRDVPVEVLSAVIDGDVGFATVADAAVGRVAVTTAPDGTKWAGLSEVTVRSDRRRKGHGRAVCDVLLAWAAARGATHAYAQVPDDNAAANGLAESMGFRLHHRARYVLL